MTCEVCLSKPATHREEGTGRLLCGVECQRVGGPFGNAFKDPFSDLTNDALTLVLLEIPPSEMRKTCVISDKAQALFDRDTFRRAYVSKHGEELLDLLKTWLIHGKSRQIDFWMKIVLAYSGWKPDIASMLQVARMGSVAAMQALLDFGIDLSDEKLGYELLSMAYHKEHLGVAHLLLRDPRVNLSDIGNLAIQKEARFGHVEEVRWLLAQPTVDPSKHKNEALYLAARHGHLDVVELLLQDPRVESYDSSILYEAAHHPDILLRLLRDYDDEIGASVPARVAETGNLELLLQLLADHRMEKGDHVIDNAIYSASRHAQAPIIHRLLQFPTAGTTEPYGGAIVQACNHDDLALVNVLLKHAKTDFAESCSQALVNASGAGFDEIVQRLLDVPNIYPAIHDNRAIEEAARGGHETVVAILLRDRRVFPTNETLRQAVNNGHRSIVKWLLQDPRVNPTWGNYRCFSHQIRDGNMDMLFLLLQDRRVNPISREIDGTILKAARRDHVGIVSHLLKDDRIWKKYPDIFHQLLDICKKHVTPKLKAFLQSYERGEKEAEQKRIKHGEGLP
jgi:ankyrin repeat protein